VTIQKKKDLHDHFVRSNKPFKGRFR